MKRDFFKRPKKFDFDLIVIGSGPAGEVTGHINSRAGKRVALVEMDTPGGECPNWGCVPTKALLYAADIYQKAKIGKNYGIHSAPRLHYAEVKKWKDLAVERTGTSHADELYKAEGIHAIKGKANFVSPWKVNVNGRNYSAKQFLISTGSRSFIPPIEGLKESGYITFKEAIDLTRLPKSIFIIGGGAIGCEFADLFSTFGSKVHMAEVAPNLLPLEDESAGKFLMEKFESDGLNVHANAKVTRVEKSGSKRTVYFQTGDELHQATVDTIMVATGKRPNTDLGLEEANVEYSRRGVTVNSYMQTSNPHIFAAGDVAGPYAFTHMAAYQGRIVANNMIHPKKRRKVDYNAVPRSVYVTPEIAAVGATEKQLIESNKPYHVVQTPVSFLGRANTSDSKEGFTKVLSDPKGRLLGAVVVNPRAGEVVHELALAVKHRLTAHDVSETIHAYPTWSESVRYACNKLSLELE